MAIVNTTAFKIYVGGVVIDDLQDVELNIETEMREVTSKDTSGGREYLPSGLYNVTGSATALFDHAATEGFSQSFADLTNGTQVALKWSDETSSNKSYSINAYCTAANLSSSGAGENATYSLSWQGTGDITEATIV